MAPLIVSAFGLFVMGLCAGLFTTPSWQTFTRLAQGWAVAGGERQTIPTSLWLAGATTVKHFSGVYAVLGGALDTLRWQLGGRLICCAARGVPRAAPMVLEVDDSTTKKAGGHLEGVACSRNGAGTARQEQRTLGGLNCVWGSRRVPVPSWPSQQVRVPSGLSLYRKEAPARTLKLPSQSRSALARASVDLVAAQLPTRSSRVLNEGGSATKDYLHHLPATVHVVGRRLSTGKLEALPPPRGAPRRGGPPQKGAWRGSPKTRARKRAGWQPPPTAAGALGQAWDGRWQTVLPGRRIRVVVGRRPAPTRHRPPGQRNPPPPVAAFFTTALTLSLAAVRAQSRERWAVAITLRASTAFPGFGQDQGRTDARVVGATTCRLVLAAARTLWFVAQARRTDALVLTRSRPWSRHKQAPSQLDLVWACRDALPDAGVFPIPRFTPGLAEIPQEPDNALPLAA